MAKGKRGTAKQELSRAANNLEMCIVHLARVRLLASEDEHKDISNYIDQLGEGVMHIQDNIALLEKRL